MKRPAAAPIRILVVDDHTIVRQGLRSILELEPDFTVVGEAADAAAAIADTARLRPDVVLLDLKLSDSAPAEGLDVCATLRDQQPAVRIVVLTTFLDQKLLVGALQRGASGYVLKDVDAVELARIIRTVHRGESGFDGRSARLVVRSLTGQPPRPPGCSASASWRWSGWWPGARPTCRPRGTCSSARARSSTTSGWPCARSAPRTAPSSSTGPAPRACSSPTQRRTLSDWFNFPARLVSCFRWPEQ